MSERDLERVPCVDDLCTGTVNAAGVCNYCAKQGRIPGPAQGGSTASEEEAESAGARNAATAEPDPAERDEPCSTVDADDRIPCADDLCTGTLDAAGVCRYCGLNNGKTRRAPAGSNGVHGS
jgi:hypothetical protein